MCIRDRCTALAVIEMLNGHGIAIPGKHVVVVGRSAVVGKPLALLLLRKSPSGNATVTVCHTGTKDIERHTRSADILVAAMGRPEAIRGDAIGDGAVVIDVGVNRLESGLCGDVDFDEAKEVAGKITPVPGGVGPMTITMLMLNTVRAAKLAAGLV